MTPVTTPVAPARSPALPAQAAQPAAPAARTEPRPARHSSFLQRAFVTWASAGLYS